MGSSVDAVSGQTIVTDTKLGVEVEIRPQRCLPRSVQGKLMAIAKRALRETKEALK